MTDSLTKFFLAKWEMIDTAPKDGTKILLLEDDRICIGCFMKGYSGYLTRICPKGWMSENLTVIFPTHWMPLPKLPRKEHRCKDGNFMCESTKIGLVLAHFGGKPIYEQIPVNYCPFCGEKAEKE